MTESVRLIIPVWGERYANKVVSITLPAVLAPGNLPELCRSFAVELVIVTETRLFDLFRRGPSFATAERICAVRLVPLDDLLTDFSTEYGITLTHALFRGFIDLGARMTETYLLFLNADFIVGDGSLRHLGQLMRQGKRLIHAPSFRVITEDVVPQLEALFDAESCTLRVERRAMVRLALAHKHPTVTARTVNQRLCRQKWMDQFYWYVDEDTLIGYQSPVALVAIKPERVVTAPVLVWDFAFIPEAAPSLTPYFITDSDDFFMIELQSRETGREMIRIGWVSLEEIAADLSLWLTKEHRESSRQLVKIHSDELPVDLEDFVAQSRAYMAEVFRRLSPKPAPHIGHPRLGVWFEDTTKRLRGDPNGTLQQAAANKRNPVVAALGALQAFYCKMFGSPPDVGKSHPLWMDVAPVQQRIARWQQAGKTNILWIKEDDWRLNRLSDLAIDAQMQPGAQQPALRGALYDACVCELALHELFDLNRLYAELRPLIKNGGQVLFKTVKPKNVLASTELFLYSCDFPDVDISEIHFYGTAATSLLRSLYVRALRQTATRSLLRVLAVGALIVLAPLVRLVNVRAARRDSTIFRSTWMSLVIEFTVKRAESAAPGMERELAAAST